MLADTSLLRPPQDKLGNDRQAFRRGTQLPAPPAPKGETGHPREAPPPAGLLDYAAFVLEQEARYCQQ
jgi:hypothetical protein